MAGVFLHITICLLLKAAFAANQAASVTKPDSKAVVSLFESRYRRAHTLRTTFLERYIENGRVVRAEAGTAYFRRPGKMRWEYESPEKNLFLVDGKTAWFYVPADHTVTRVPVKESTDWRTPLALLAGEMKVSRVCAKVESTAQVKPETPEDVMLYCQVRGTGVDSRKPSSQEPSFQGSGTKEAVFFELASKTGDLVRVLIKDAAGVEIEFHFANWQSDPSVDESLFLFHPPPGVAIVNGDLPASSGGINP